MADCYQVGARVGVMLEYAKGGELKLIGYGTYKGMEVPPQKHSVTGDFLWAIQKSNPKIELDNGEVVWGFECWWAPEDTIKQLEQNAAEITVVDIVEVRKTRQLKTKDESW